LLDNEPGCFSCTWITMSDRIITFWLIGFFRTQFNCFFLLRFLIMSDVLLVTYLNVYPLSLRMCFFSISVSYQNWFLELYNFKKFHGFYSCFWTSFASPVFSWIWKNLQLAWWCLIILSFLFLPTCYFYTMLLATWAFCQCVHLEEKVLPESHPPLHRKIRQIEV